MSEPQKNFDLAGRVSADCAHVWVHMPRFVQCSKCHAFDGDWDMPVESERCEEEQ